MISRQISLAASLTSGGNRGGGGEGGGIDLQLRCQLLMNCYRQERGQRERGFSRATIGEKLQVSPRTIENYMKKIPQDIVLVSNRWRLRDS